MNITGRFVQLLPEMKGEGKNGPWSRQDFIIETEEQFPKKVCISVWNNKVNVRDLLPGDPVSVEISVESREYNGRWYTDVKAWQLVVNKAKEPGTEAASAGTQDTFQHTRVPEDLPEDTESQDDLPF